MSEKLPDLFELRIKYSVYPGQPLVCAAAIVRLFDSLEDAASPSLDSYTGKPYGWCKAEGSESPGAGGQNSKAVRAMLAWREHRDMDCLIEELHEGWGRTVLHQEPFKDSWNEGMEKAKALEPALREALEAWLS